MDKKQKYAIGSAILIGVTPLLVFSYANVAKNIRGMPGCEILSTKEACDKRNSQIHVPGIIWWRGGRVILCAFGVVTGKWGQLLEQTMCK
jgi:hypothetical protein